MPRKVSAIQWLILTEELPVGAWRERLELPSNCQLCNAQLKETLQHASQECEEICRVWTLFRQIRQVAGLPPSYVSWKNISRGLLQDPSGPSVEETLRWDTTAAFKITKETPWDILRAQLLWAIWCQRVEVAFWEDNFHLRAILCQAWKNTLYCAIEAYKELSRHTRNEEKRMELIACFQRVWTQAGIFRRMRGADLKWHLTPHAEFLPVDLSTWNATPIRINRLSPSPDPEAEFAARADFADLVDDFIQGVSARSQTEDHEEAQIDAIARQVAENPHRPNEEEVWAPNTTMQATTPCMEVHQRQRNSTRPHHVQPSNTSQGEQGGGGRKRGAKHPPWTW